MCGFVGLIDLNSKPVYPDLLRKMVSRIHHRGPDDEGYFIKGNLGLYHKRLSIIDIKGGHQPMSFNGITIVYNGEIYNYIELREELKSKGHSFQTTSDTEVVLHMYEEYGDDFVNLLNGMFAFVIHDSRRNRLFIARDHFGIKPLYIYHDTSIIAFASEIKALLVHERIKAIPDYDGLNEYLTFQFVLGEGTLFKDIKKIQPGHYCTIDLNDYQIRHKKYWEPDFQLDTHHTEEYFVENLRGILDEIVFQQLRSDVPVGTYLSGGIDSSLVTMLSAKHYGNQLQSFTGAFREGPEFSEMPFAEIVAKQANSQLHKIYPTEQQFVDNLSKLIYHLDEPVAGPGLFPQFMVSKYAAENVKVVLGGQGGDEIFGGYTRYLVAYLEQAIKGAIFESNEEGEHIVSLNSILPNLPSLQQYIPMMKSFWKTDAFSQMDKRYFALINRMGGTQAFLSNEYLENYNEEAIFNQFSKFFNHIDTQSYYNKMTHFDMISSLPGLLQVEDRVSMAVSIESRVPLLDRRIVDLVSKMPAGMKFKGAELKYLLKKAIHDLIPKSILNRKDKMGFPVPLHHWIKNNSKDFVMDIFNTQKSKERGILNTTKIEQMISSEQPFNRGLWGLLCLEIWFGEFID